MVDTLLFLPRGEDTVGVDDDAAAADPGHATKISSPLLKGGNGRPGAGEGLPPCLRSLVAMLKKLLVSVDRMGYWSTTYGHRDLTAVAEDGVRLGIDVGGCLHGYEMERRDVEGCLGIRGHAL